MLVDYNNVRKDIRDGDILLCSGTGTFSRLIQKFTDSKWSHVGFILWAKRFDRLMVMESKESHGVRSVPLSSYQKYKGKVTIWRDSRWNGPDLKKLGQFAIDHLGYSYDKKAIAKLALRISLNLKREREDDDKFICSEFAAVCFEQVGLDYEWPNSGIIVPDHFATATTTTRIYDIRTDR